MRSFRSALFFEPPSVTSVLLLDHTQCLLMDHHSRPPSRHPLQSPVYESSVSFPSSASGFRPPLALPRSLRELCLLALLVFSSSALHTEAFHQAFRSQVLKPFLHLGFPPPPPPFLPPYVIWLSLTPASSLIPSAFSSEKPRPHSSG